MIMSTFLDKIKIKTGLGRKNKFDLSCDHVTTQEIFNLRPIYSRELMPQQSISVKPSSLVRLAPMFKPMFGSLKLVNRAFFVPYRTVFEGFNSFMVNAPFNRNGNTYMVTQAPNILTSDIVHELSQSTYSTSVQAQQGEPYDFAIPSVSNGVVVYDYRILTRKGQILMTILNSLGYNVNTIETTLSTTTANYDEYVSALPIFAYAKIIADWYVNNQYVTRRNGIETIITKYGTGGYVTASDFSALCTYIVYSLYENDYFTAAFDNPVNPTGSSISGYSIPDVTNDNTSNSSSVLTRSIVQSQNGPGNVYPSTPVIAGSTGGSPSSTYTQYTANISQFMIDTLKSLTDFMKRYELVGSSILDRYLAEYGVSLPAEKLNRCIYLGKSETYIQVSDVMSSADTSAGGVVGDYAAKGIGYADGSRFSYSSDEFGMLMIISTIIPRAQYSQGIQRRNFHIDRLDFFHGDFDALGPQAISKSELFADFKTKENFDIGNSEAWKSTGIFGYTPRYSEYAVAQDLLSGCFRFNSQNVDLKQWHLFRLFDPETQDELNLVSHHSEQFSVGDPDQYNRIFNYTGPADGDGNILPTDHFFCVHHFDVESYMPKKPLFDQYDFDDGRSIMMNLGGSNLN